MTAVLEVDGLAKHFGHGDTRVVAMDGVSLSMSEGENVALIGPSGAGKSTLLTVLGMIRPPDGGVMTFGGREVFRDGYRVDVRAFRRRNLGFVFQKANLLPFLTALENVRLAMEINDMPPKDAKARAVELLDYLELGDRLDFYPSQLSGGQQQRVAIARALGNRPKLLLADEPTAALDSVRGRQVMELFRKVAHTQNTGVMVVTHDQRSLEVFDRILLMEDGRLRPIDAKENMPKI